MLGRGGLVKVVQEGVVDSVDEELAPSRVGLASVRHGNGEWLVGELGACRVTAELIRDVTSSVTSNGTLARHLEGGTTIGSTSTSSSRGGIPGEGASELVHKVGNHTVEVKTIVTMYERAREGEVSKIRKGLGLV